MNNKVSVDTLEANHLVGKIEKIKLKELGFVWSPIREKPNIFRYVLNKENIRIYYYPISKLISPKISLPKFYYGSNAEFFDLEDNYKLDNFYEKINNTLNTLLVGLDIPDFREFQGTEIHPYKDLKFRRKYAKAIIKTLKKIENAVWIRTPYKSGVQFRHKSKVFTVYDKDEEINKRRKDDIKSKFKRFVTKLDILKVNKSKRTARLELQIKRKALYNLEGKGKGKGKGKCKSRKVCDLLDYDFISEQFNKTLKQLHISDDIIKRKELVKEIYESKIIKTNKTAEKLIRFIDVYNNPRISIYDHYSDDRIYYFLNLLRQLKYSPVFLIPKCNIISVNFISEKLEVYRCKYITIRELIKTMFIFLDEFYINKIMYSKSIYVNIWYNIQFGLQSKLYFDTS